MDELEQPKTFRDTVSTVDKEGHRKWIYALQPKGFLYKLRTYISWVYLAIFFAIPFIKINNIPFLEFNILERRFIFFGKIFTPDDFFIFAVGMITFIVFVVLFTVIFGRIFCGWVCPQTIFMEMVFRKIEYWIEGSANDQKVLDRSTWNTNKIMKRGGKHLVFFLLSFIIANTLLSYIIGIDDLIKYIKEPFYEHIGLLLGLLFFTFAFYAVFAFIRELACIVICPYGRLQSVLLDKDTVVVAYDYVRGEPREKIHKGNERKSGDCIDCNQCVAVCPTGIDIRNGTQMECTNCTACIDVCNFMMDKVGLPKDLIRYASENNIEKSEKLKFTTRMKAYTVVLALLIALMTFLLVTRNNIDAHITRAKGQLYTEVEGHKLANYYQIKLINKTNEDIALDVKLEDVNGEIKLVGTEKVIAKSLMQGKANFMVILDEDLVKAYKRDIKIGLYNGNKKVREIETNFLGPFK
jgi:cytochrome c oxidase accessory protein FixG